MYYVYILGVLDEKANAVNIELQNFFLVTRAAFPEVENGLRPALLRAMKLYF
jgi:hypothetical protein